MNRLREALNDSAEHPRFIETLPRQGYRFIATLNSGPMGKGFCLSALVVNQLREEELARYRCVVAGSCMAGPLSILERTRRNSPNWQMESVSALAGYQARPSFSPDGNSIVFDYQREQGVDADNTMPTRTFTLSSLATKRCSGLRPAGRLVWRSLVAKRRGHRLYALVRGKPRQIH